LDVWTKVACELGGDSVEEFLKESITAILLLGEWPSSIDRPGALEQVKTGLEAALRGSFFSETPERHYDPSDKKMKTASL
jgi:hypothetical protein